MKQEVIPKLQKTEYAITYRIAINDNYLQSLNIDNPNPSIYTSQDGLELQDLIVDGYEFKGWYTAQTGGTRVTAIQKGSTGNRTLYAQWNKVEYIIDFDSPDAPVSSITYTVDRGTTLTNPSWFGYTFVQHLFHQASAVLHLIHQKLQRVPQSVSTVSIRTKKMMVQA